MATTGRRRSIGWLCSRFLGALKNPASVGADFLPK
jgi:hypothetical protein